MFVDQILHYQYKIHYSLSLSICYMMKQVINRDLNIFPSFENNLGIILGSKTDEC